jgi:thymidine phosphorylase
MFAIIKDISENKLTDTMITYYAASNFVTPASDHELYITAKAMAETGEMLKFDGVVADKHCIGGVP